MPTKILLYDDNEAFRVSIQSLIRDLPDLEILAAMPNAETIEIDLQELKPDVVLMDIDMPAVNGVEAVKRIRKKYKDLPIIMLTIFDDNENIFNAICAGASGYILKGFAIEEIPSGIRNVITGGAPMTGSIAKKVLQMVPQAKTIEQENGKLSKKETEILVFLSKGHSYKMIAAELDITIDAVRFHIKKIYDSLHVHTAAGAVSKAIKDKLISLLL